MSLLVLLLLLFLLVGGLPNWGYHRYGFAPSGIAGLMVLIIVLMLLTGRLRF